jgi:type I restriction enzyme S subunit
MTFTPMGDRIDASWARWWFLSERGLELIGQASPGSAGRNRTLAIERFEALEIPLPPIEDQRRVSTRLDHVANTTSTLSACASHASALASALAVSATARPDLDESAKRLAGWEQVPLRAVLTPSKAQVVVEATRTYPNVGIYSFGRGLFKKPDIDGSATSAKTLNGISSGQFIYSRLFAFEGAYAHVPETFDGYFVSNEFPTFDVDSDRLDAGWLATYLRSPARWEELRGSSKGLGVRRQRVPVEAILDYRIWLPPRSVQHQTIALLAQLEESQMLRLQGDNRIDALLPAAMNEAFAGLS